VSQVRLNRLDTYQHVLFTDVVYEGAVLLL